MGLWSRIKERRRGRKLMPLLMVLRAYGNDYEMAKELIERIWRLFKGKAEGNFEEKLELVEGLTKANLNPILDYVWLWPNVMKGQFLPKRVWVRKAYFANTSAIELTMMNIFFLMFTKLDQKIKSEKVNDDKYKDALGNMLGHLIKRKVWSWKRWRFVDAEYDTGACIDIGKRMLDLDASLVFWLIRYFEDTLKWFVTRFSTVFGSEESGGKSLFKNNEGWMAVLEDVAKQGVHGDFEKVSRTPCITVWLYLEHEKIKADAMATG